MSCTSLPYLSLPYQHFFFERPCRRRAWRMVRWNRSRRHVRIRNHPGTVRWTPSLDQTGALTHHLFAGEHLRKCQGLALHLPLAHLSLKLFHQFSIDQGQARVRSMAVVRMEIGVLSNGMREPGSQSNRRALRSSATGRRPSGGARRSRRCPRRDWSHRVWRDIGDTGTFG